MKDSELQPGQASPGGLVARLRHQVGPHLPRALHRIGARLVTRIAAWRGSRYQVGRHQLRFLDGSAPTVLVDSSDGRSRLDALQLSLFCQAIRPGYVVVDAGGYRGTYTVIGAAYTGAQGQVIAFEPTASNAALIERNVRLNGFASRVQVECMALGDGTGVADFYVRGDATTNTLTRDQADATRISVNITSLDDYFRGRRGVDVLKLDIEGGELAALRGASSLLAGTAFIMCELHPYAWAAAGHNGEDLRALLRNYDRYTADLETGEEIADYRYGAVLLRKRQ